MRRNKSFLIRHLMKIDSNFARNPSLSKVKFLIKNASKKISQMDLKIELRRK
jgi:hypothetical protein